MTTIPPYQRIPVRLIEKDFNEFVLPHLTVNSRGPQKKISSFKIFNYILKLLHTGCQWYNLPIDADGTGKPEIHYTNIFRSFQAWVTAGCFDKIFEGSVKKLAKASHLDIATEV